MDHLRRGVRKFLTLTKELLLFNYGLSESDYERGDRQRAAERNQQRQQKGRPFYGQ